MLARAIEDPNSNDGKLVNTAEVEAGKVADLVEGAVAEKEEKSGRPVSTKERQKILHACRLQRKKQREKEDEARVTQLIAGVAALKVGRLEIRKGRALTKREKKRILAKTRLKVRQPARSLMLSRGFA